MTDRETYSYNTKENEINVLAKGKTYGPYEKVNYLRTQPDTDFFSFTYNKGGKQYINVKGKDYGPYDKASVISGPSGVFMISYMLNGGAYIWANEKKYGPYKKIGRANVENGKFFFSAERDDKFHICVNGKETSGYSNVLWGSSPSFQRYKKDGKSYYNVNNKQIEINFAQIIESKDKKHSLLAGQKGKKLYIDGKQIKQEDTFMHQFDEKSNSFTWFSIEGMKVYINEYKL